MEIFILYACSDEGIIISNPDPYMQQLHDDEFKSDYNRNHLISSLCSLKQFLWRSKKALNGNVCYLARAEIILEEKQQTSAHFL